jgi:hypothetical protein
MPGLRARDSVHNSGKLKGLPYATNHASIHVVHYESIILFQEC